MKYIKNVICVVYMSSAPMLSGHYYTLCCMHVKHVCMCPDINISCLQIFWFSCQLIYILLVWGTDLLPANASTLIYYSPWRIVWNHHVNDYACREVKNSLKVRISRLLSADSFLLAKDEAEIWTNSYMPLSCFTTPNFFQ